MYFIHHQLLAFQVHLRRRKQKKALSGQVNDFIKVALVHFSWKNQFSLVLRWLCDHVVKVHAQDFQKFKKTQAGMFLLLVQSLCLNMPWPLRHQ